MMSITPFCSEFIWIVCTDKCNVLNCEGKKDITVKSSNGGYSTKRIVFNLQQDLTCTIDELNQSKCVTVLEMICIDF
jgi:hypothetical protein